MPNSPCNYTTQISEEECIGDSLDTINANFSALDVAVCNLVTTPITVSDSSTIDLSLTTNKILSADVRPNSIRYSQLASWQTLSASPTLSAEAVTQRVAKAWVNFDVSTNIPVIRSSFNVSSIGDVGVGIYGVSFITNFSNTNYSCVGTGNGISNYAFAAPLGVFARAINYVQLTTSSPNVGFPGLPGYPFDTPDASVVFFSH